MSYIRCLHETFPATSPATRKPPCPGK
jgi:hypothetical protein